MRAARSRRHERCGTPVPVENQTSSQQPGARLMMSSVSSQRASVSVLPGERRSIKRGKPPPNAVEAHKTAARTRKSGARLLLKVEATINHMTSYRDHPFRPNNAIRNLPTAQNHSSKDRNVERTSSLPPCARRLLGSRPRLRSFWRIPRKHQRRIVSWQPYTCRPIERN